MNNLIVCNTNIREYLEDRYCLNDLHKAAGGLSKDQPSKWVMLQSTKELIEELKSSNLNLVVEQNQPLIVINGGNNQGTYVVKELVYAYAMWISPKFNLQVIRAYDTMVNNNRPIKEYTELELARNYVRVLEEKDLLEKRVEFLEPFKTKVDGSKVIFPRKESVYDQERGFKKDLKELCPFLSNDKITNILEFYTTKKYKNTDYYIKDEIEYSAQKFIEECITEIKGTKKSVILYHNSLPGGKTVVNKDLAIQYLGKCEEDFE